MIVATCILKGFKWPHLVFPLCSNDLSPGLSGSLGLCCHGLLESLRNSYISHGWGSFSPLISYLTSLTSTRSTKTPHGSVAASSTNFISLAIESLNSFSQERSDWQITVLTFLREFLRGFWFQESSWGSRLPGSGWRCCSHPQRTPPCCCHTPWQGYSGEMLYCLSKLSL